MTYATKQLTEDLQKLTHGETSFEACNSDSSHTETAEGDTIRLSEEIEKFVETRREYSARTRSANYGTY